MLLFIILFSMATANVDPEPRSILYDLSTIQISEYEAGKIHREVTQNLMLTLVTPDSNILCTFLDLQCVLSVDDEIRHTWYLHMGPSCHFYTEAVFTEDDLDLNKIVCTVSQKLIANKRILPEMSLMVHPFTVGLFSKKFALKKTSKIVLVGGPTPSSGYNSIICKQEDGSSITLKHKKKQEYEGKFTYLPTGSAPYFECDVKHPTEEYHVHTWLTPNSVLAMHLNEGPNFVKAELLVFNYKEFLKNEDSFGLDRDIVLSIGGRKLRRVSESTVPGRQQFIYNQTLACKVKECKITLTYKGDPVFVPFTYFRVAVSDTMFVFPPGSPMEYNVRAGLEGPKEMVTDGKSDVYFNIFSPSGIYQKSFSQDDIDLNQKMISFPFNAVTPGFLPSTMMVTFAHDSPNSLAKWTKTAATKSYRMARFAKAAVRFNSKNRPIECVIAVAVVPVAPDVPAPEVTQVCYVEKGEIKGCLRSIPNVPGVYAGKLFSEAVPAPKNWEGKLVAKLTNPASGQMIDIPSPEYNIKDLATSMSLHFDDPDNRMVMVGNKLRFKIHRGKSDLGESELGEISCSVGVGSPPIGPSGYEDGYFTLIPSSIADNALMECIHTPASGNGITSVLQATVSFYQPLLVADVASAVITSKNDDTMIVRKLELSFNICKKNVVSATFGGACIETPPLENIRSVYYNGIACSIPQYNEISELYSSECTLDDSVHMQNKLAIVLDGVALPNNFLPLTLSVPYRVVHRPNRGVLVSVPAKSHTNMPLAATVPGLTGVYLSTRPESDPKPGPLSTPASTTFDANRSEFVFTVPENMLSTWINKVIVSYKVGAVSMSHVFTLKTHEAMISPTLFPPASVTNVTFIVKSDPLPLLLKYALVPSGTLTFPVIHSYALPVEGEPGKYLGQIRIPQPTTLFDLLIIDNNEVVRMPFEYVPMPALEKHTPQSMSRKKNFKAEVQLLNPLGLPINFNLGARCRYSTQTDDEFQVMDWDTKLNAYICAPGSFPKDWHGDFVVEVRGKRFDSFIDFHVIPIGGIVGIVISIMVVAIILVGVFFGVLPNIRRKKAAKHAN